MTNLNIINRFFNERIRVNPQQKPLLQKLKNICELRACGKISEQKAMFKINEVTNGNIFNGMSNFNQIKTPNIIKNPFAGVRTKQKKKKAILEGLFDYNNKPHKEQFPVLGLKPLKSKGKKKRFIVSPGNRTWFDSNKFNKNINKSANNINKMFGITKNKKVNNKINFNLVGFKL